MPALALRKARRGGQVVDRLRQALGIHGQARLELGRQPGKETEVLGGGVGQHRRDLRSVRSLHSRDGTP